MPIQAADYTENAKPLAQALARESAARVRLSAEVTDLRNRLGRYVLGGEGEMFSLARVLDELCRILEEADRER